MGEYKELERLIEESKSRLARIDSILETSTKLYISLRQSLDDQIHELEKTIKKSLVK